MEADESRRQGSVKDNGEREIRQCILTERQTMLKWELGTSSRMQPGTGLNFGSFGIVLTAENGACVFVVVSDGLESHAAYDAAMHETPISSKTRYASAGL